MNKTQFREKAATIPYQYRHPEMIYALIRWLRITTAIEIGTHIGMTACWMARAIQENGGGRLVCIDPFCWVQEKQEEQWCANVEMCGISDTVILIKGRSQEVEWPTAEFVFVDGNHTYPVAKHDAEKARNIGARCIILHDTVSWEGSRKHAEEVRTDPAWSEWDKIEANFDQGIMILLKREPKGPCEGEDIGEKWDVPTNRKSFLRCRNCLFQFTPEVATKPVCPDCGSGMNLFTP